MLRVLDEVNMTAGMFPGTPLPRHGGNSGIVPPWGRGGPRVIKFRTRPNPAGGFEFLREVFGHHNAGVTHTPVKMLNPPSGSAPAPGGLLAFFNRYGRTAIPPRQIRMRGILGLVLGGVTPIGFQPRPQGTLGDDAPDISFSAIPDIAPTSMPMPDISAMMPATPIAPPSTVTPSAQSDFGSVFGSILGTVLGTGAKYELNRFNSGLMSKTYSPQNTQAALMAYGNQGAVLNAQAQAERMQRELDFERQTGARAGGVVSTGLLLAGAAGLVLFLALRRPRSEGAA